MTKLLVFDLDGTLVDTMGDYGDQAAKLMHQSFQTELQHARLDYFRTSGLPFHQQLKILYPDRQDTEAVAQAFEGWKDSYLLNTRLPAATERLLQVWRAQGLLVAISSNNQAHYVERMARDWPVDAALGYRQFDGFAKGEAHFAALEKMFGVSRAEMIFTGDSPNDARIALSCGVRFRALLTPEFSHADFLAVDASIKIIDKLDDLDVAVLAHACQR